MFGQWSTRHVKFYWSVITVRFDLSKLVMICQWSLSWSLTGQWSQAFQVWLVTGLCLVRFDQTLVTVLSGLTSHWSLSCPVCQVTVLSGLSGQSCQFVRSLSSQWSPRLVRHSWFIWKLSAMKKLTFLVSFITCHCRWSLSEVFCNEETHFSSFIHYLSLQMKFVWSFLQWRNSLF